MKQTLIEQLSNPMMLVMNVEMKMECGQECERTDGKLSHSLGQPREPLLLAHVLVRLPGVLELRIRALDLGLQGGLVFLLPVHARRQVP